MLSEIQLQARGHAVLPSDAPLLFLALSVFSPTCLGNLPPLLGFVCPDSFTDG